MPHGLKRVAVFTLLGFVGLIVVLVLAAMALAFLAARGAVDEADGLLWLIGGFSVLVMIGALGVGVAWMRSIDEAAREAHKSAWFWGGSAGMAVGGVALIMASLPQAERLEIPAWYAGRSDPATYAATGAVAMMALMLAGYAVAWAWWWWKRR
jgi:hypothetical protein